MVSMVAIMDNANIQLLNETLKIMHDGHYMVNGNDVQVKLSLEEMVDCVVLLPDHIDAICHEMETIPLRSCNICEFTCANDDSFSSAKSKYMLEGENKHLL